MPAIVSAPAPNSGLLLPEPPDGKVRLVGPEKIAHGDEYGAALGQGRARLCSEIATDRDECFIRRQTTQGFENRGRQRRLEQQHCRTRGPGPWPRDRLVAGPSLT